MPKNTTATGKLGEDLACAYVVNNGYKILKRNYREKWGEIDIIGKAKDGTIVFFEVKTLEGVHPGLKPEDNLTSSKLKKLRRTCQIIAAKQDSLLDGQNGWRIDLLAIVLIGPDLMKNHEVRHYENI